MLIANPIYDTVFGYLMNDLEIAKGIISTIIEKDKALDEKDKAVEALKEQKQYYEELLKKLGHQV
ncbi:MAG: hypothetical protein ACM3SY_17660 [Candidatus Omnitrophota bacterium]